MSSDSYVYIRKYSFHNLTISMANKLKSVRLKAKLTQQQVGDVFNISRESVAQWESRDKSTRPDTRKLKKLADIYGVSINNLLDDSITQAKTNKKSSNKKNKTVRKHTIDSLAREVQTVRNDISSILKILKNVTTKQPKVFDMKMKKKRRTG